MGEENLENDEFRIGLLDVTYGVVLGYGFGFFDKTTITTDYIRFTLAFAAVVVDWLYVHPLYRQWGYKSNIVFVLDLLILFTLSRLFQLSAPSESNQYWFWMSILFWFYLGWDILAKTKGFKLKYDWRFAMGGDTVAALVFLAVYLLLTQAVLKPSIFLTVLLALAYFLAVCSWLKKQSPSKSC